MQNFLFELKKMMHYRKGFWCITLFLAISLIGLILTDQPQNLEMEKYQEGYSQYLQQLTGPYSKGKADYLEAEAHRIAKATEAREELLDSYYAGLISQNEFKTQFAEQKEILKNQQGFDVLYDQYLYVCEHPENRYFLSTNGWSGLFNQNTFPFLLFLALLLMIVPIFCSEAGNQMDVLIRTTREGKRAVTHQVLLAGDTAILLCLSEALVRFLFFAVKYGLPSGDAPIQSISYFGEYSQALSLMAGYWVMAVMRCIGCLALAVFILFLSVLVRKYALTLLIAVAVTLLPYLALTSNQIHHLPLPLAFLMAADFFKGTVTSSDPLTGEEAVLFQEVGRGELQILTGILLFAVIGMLLWVRRKTANQWNKLSKRMGYRSLAGLLCVLTLSGCAVQPAEQRGITAYNSSSDLGIHGYEMIFDDENRPAYLQNPSSEEKIVLNRSPFAETANAGTIHSVFYQGNDVYYLKTKTESYIDRVGVYNSTADIVSIIRLDTQTLEETVIWEQIISTGRSVLGIEYEVSDQWSFLTKYSKFFLDGSSLFFICDSNIRKVDRKTNQISIIDISAIQNIAFDGRNIFYLDQFSKLTKYDTQAAVETEIAGVIAENFFLTEEKIFFINRMDNYKIYSCNLDGNKQEKVTDAPAIYITVKGQSIYYTDKRDGQQYSICLTDSNCSPKKVG